MKSQAILARFQLAGGKVEWQELSPKKCVGIFSHPAGGSLRVEWTIEMAKQAGVFRDGSGWTKYPEDMLRARAISRGVRAVYPACILGHYATEEVQDFTPAPAKDMGVAERVDIPEVLEADDGAFCLYVPGNSEPYAAFHTKEEWVGGYVNMVARLHKSDKLPDDVKAEKLDSLKASNMLMLESLDSIQKIKIRSGLVEAGVSLSPKPEQSQQGYPDTGHSEEIF